MTRKNTILIAVAALTICMTSAFAYAGQGRGQGPGPSGGQGLGPCQAQYQGLTPEKQAVVDGIRKEHQQKVFGLRQNVQAKQAMLDALLLDPKASEKKINETTKELNQAKAKMIEERVAHKLKMAEETGVRTPMGRRVHAGRGGAKHGRGPGAMRACNGPGRCLQN